MIGRRMISSGCMAVSSPVLGASALEAAGLQRLRGVLRDDQVIVPEEVIDVDALGRKEVVVFEVPEALHELVVGGAVDDERLLVGLERAERAGERLGLDLGQLEAVDD